MTDDPGPDQATDRSRDLRIAGALRLGDEAAVRALLERLAPRLRSITWNLAAGKLEPQDLIQEAVIKMVSAPVLDAYRGDGPLDGYLLSVATRHVISVSRTERSREQRTQADADPGMHAGAAPPPQEAIDGTLRDALAQLPQRTQTVVLLIAVGDLSYAEVASTLGMELNTVKSTYSRARTALRTELDDS